MNTYKAAVGLLVVGGLTAGGCASPRTAADFNEKEIQQTHVVAGALRATPLAEPTSYDSGAISLPRNVTATGVLTPAQIAVYSDDKQRTQIALLDRATGVLQALEGERFDTRLAVSNPATTRDYMTGTQTAAFYNALEEVVATHTATLRELYAGSAWSPSVSLNIGQLEQAVATGTAATGVTRTVVTPTADVLAVRRRLSESRASAEVLRDRVYDAIVAQWVAQGYGNQLDKLLHTYSLLEGITTGTDTWRMGDAAIRSVGYKPEDIIGSFANETDRIGVQDETTGMGVRRALTTAFLDQEMEGKPTGIGPVEYRTGLMRVTQLENIAGRSLPPDDVRKNSGPARWARIAIPGYTGYALAGTPWTPDESIDDSVPNLHNQFYASFAGIKRPVSQLGATYYNDIGLSGAAFLIEAGIGAGVALGSGSFRGKSSDGPSGPTAPKAPEDFGLIGRGSLKQRRKPKSHHPRFQRNFQVRRQ